MEANDIDWSFQIFISLSNRNLLLLIVDKVCVSVVNLMLPIRIQEQLKLESPDACAHPVMG